MTCQLQVQVLFLQAQPSHFLAECFHNPKQGQGLHIWQWIQEEGLKREIWDIYSVLSAYARTG